jgi:hypothetical protein
MWLIIQLPLSRALKCIDFSLKAFDEGVIKLMHISGHFPLSISLKTHNVSKAGSASIISYNDNLISWVHWKKLITIPGDRDSNVLLQQLELLNGFSLNFIFASFIGIC